MRIKKLGLFLVFLTCLGSLAEAATTGWITGRQFWIKSGEIDRAGWMPVSLKCVDSGAPDLSLESAYVRVEYQPNPKHIGWWWMGSTNLKHDVKDMEAQGYHLVSKDSFTRKKTGLTIYCLIFHK